MNSAKRLMPTSCAKNVIAPLIVAKGNASDCGATLESIFVRFCVCDLLL